MGQQQHTLGNVTMASDAAAWTLGFACAAHLASASV